MKNSLNEAEAAELALKAYIAGSTPEILADMTEGQTRMREIADLVELTEAREDAVCSLIIDLMYYCVREKIDWNHDVLSRARGRFRNGRRQLSAR